ncbi:MAG: rod shape-determining protein RodA, partial [Candidatus Pacebacteria bacterium]|nr:rod shape-determining protein RodA [Candidatus Paceibacterota bacterium]
MSVSKILGRVFSSVDPILIISVLFIAMFGLSAMSSLNGNEFLYKQSIWLIVAAVVFVLSSFIDYRFLRRSAVVTTIYIGTVLLLSVMFIIGSSFQGAQSWVDFGSFTVQPSEFAKLALISILAKYFSRRHIEIASLRHILVSGAYTLIMAVLILLQPDFGSAMIVALVWFGMVLASGISKRHIALLFIVAMCAGLGAWQFVFEDYQKSRIISFVHPMADVQGVGYNAYQSTIAVGSGGVLGKGLGYGTQSKLKFLPEYETDFIFAAYAEEWGFVGVLILFAFFTIVVWRLLYFASRGVTNFEILFTVGV